MSEEYLELKDVKSNKCLRFSELLTKAGWNIHQDSLQGLGSVVLAELLTRDLISQYGIEDLMKVIGNVEPHQACQCYKRMGRKADLCGWKDVHHDVLDDAIERIQGMVIARSLIEVATPKEILQAMKKDERDAIEKEIDNEQKEKEERTSAE